LRHIAFAGGPHHSFPGSEQRRTDRFLFRYFGFQGFGTLRIGSLIRRNKHMKFSSIVARRRVAGISAGCLLGGIAMGIVGAPSAAAAPDCSPGGVNSTVMSARGAAEQYLAAHPGANQVVTAAYGQPRGEAAASLRGYFTAHPNEYYDLRGILAPIGDTERQCNVAALPPNLESAYQEFMAG
jgi:hemophore-related protein